MNNGMEITIEPAILRASALVPIAANMLRRPFETSIMECESDLSSLQVPSATRFGQMKEFHAPIIERMMIVVIVGIAIGIMTLSK